MGYGVRWCPNPPPGLAPFIEPSPMKGASIRVRTAAVGLRVRSTPDGRPGLVRAATTRLAQVYLCARPAPRLLARGEKPAFESVGGLGLAGRRSTKAFAHPAGPRQRRLPPRQVGRRVGVDCRREPVHRAQVGAGPGDGLLADS